MGIVIEEEGPDNSDPLLSQYIHMRQMERYYRARAEYYRSVADSMKSKIDMENSKRETTKKETVDTDPFLW